MKIKLLFINSTLEGSGLTNVIYNICLKINYEKFDVHIVTLSPEPINSKKNDFSKLPIKIYSLNQSRLKGFFFAKKKLKEIINKINPDIIHTHSYRSSVLINKISGNYTKISTLHGILENNYVNNYGKFFGKIIAQHQLQAFGKAKFKTVCSESLNKYYETKFENLIVIKNGVDENIFFKINAIEKQKLKIKLNFSETDRIILSVGALNCLKDPITIIEAFKKSNLVDNYKLIFLGEGPLKQECIRIAEGFNIYFFGNKNNVHDYLKVADFYISASLSEGLPNSVLEAGMVGLTCILSDIPQHQEVFQEVPSQAVFFDTKNTEMLVSILNKFVFVENVNVIDFSAQKMTILYENLYLNALNISDRKI